MTETIRKRRNYLQPKQTEIGNVLQKAAKRTKNLIWACYELRMQQKAAMRDRMAASLL
jgi:hypothetical protein